MRRVSSSFQITGETNMLLSVKCSCGKGLKVKEEAAGKKVKCPACGHLTLVPLPNGDEQERALTLQQSEHGECPSCQAELAANAILCIECGFNLKTGKKVKTKRISPPDNGEGTQEKARPKDREKWKAFQRGLGFLNVLGILNVLLIPLALFVASRNVPMADGQVDPRQVESAFHGQEKVWATVAGILALESLALLGYCLCLSVPLKRPKPWLFATLGAGALCVVTGPLLIIHPMNVMLWFFVKSLKMGLFLFFLRSIKIAQNYEEPTRDVIKVLGPNILVWCCFLFVFGLGMAGQAATGSIRGAVVLALLIACFSLAFGYLRTLRDLSITIDRQELS